MELHSLRWAIVVNDPVVGAALEPGAGDGQPLPVAMLHGFTQTRRCWGPLADALANTRTVVTADLPGHGSAAAEAGLDCSGAAQVLVRRIGPAHWVGYSLGGRIALHAALAYPDHVNSLVLIGATAGIEDPGERAERRLVDEERAERLEAVGVSAFCSQWLDMDMFADLPGWARFESERSSNTVQGLAASLRNAGTGSMAPLWNELATLSMPVLCIAGADDPRFAAHAAHMADAIGDNATVTLIDGAGHAAHLERPDATASVVRQFLDDLEP